MEHQPSSDNVDYWGLNSHPFAPTLFLPLRFSSNQPLYLSHWPASVTCLHEKFIHPSICLLFDQKWIYNLLDLQNSSSNMVCGTAASEKPELLEV